MERIRDLFYKYIDDKYKYNPNKNIMMNIELKKLYDYIDPESPLYIPNLFNENMSDDIIIEIFKNGFKSVIWNKYKENEKKILSQVITTEANTNLICNKCNLKRINQYEIQSRRADEPATIKFSCLNCGHKWNS